MHASSRRTALGAALATLALVVSACAGSSEGASSKDGADKGTATTTTTAPAAMRAAGPGEVATGKAVPSAGCGTSTVRALDLDKQFLDDSDRWFLLTTPAEHDGETPLPLVFDFHGLSEGADIHSKMSAFSPFAQEHGFILVTPNGTGTPIRWVATTDDTNPDLAYTTDLLDQLEGELCVDTSRVYATGLSNGAFMSSAVGCALSDRFAAVAPVAGVTHPTPCDASRPMPLLSFHGTADPILLFNGGVGDRLGEIMEKGVDQVDASNDATPEADIDGPGYPEAIRGWAAQNGCKDTPTDEQLTDSVLARTYDCPAEGAVEFLVIQDGGHSWPGSEFSQAVERVVGPTDMSIDADELIWAFFQRFQLPES